MSAVDYRVATVDDAAAIGAIHVAAWRETYAGLLPHAMLDSLSVQSRAAMWTTVLRAPDATDGNTVFVAECSGRIVGFGACGGQRDGTLRERGFNGEIGAIYILQSHQGAGYGRSLMGMMAHDLIARRFASASVWVLRENTQARKFYERLDGLVIGGRTLSEGDVELPEVAYGWSDLSGKFQTREFSLPASPRSCSQVPS